jgi:hypothetical protein
MERYASGKPLYNRLVALGVITLALMIMIGIFLKQKDIRV